MADPTFAHTLEESAIIAPVYTPVTHVVIGRAVQNADTSSAQVRIVDVAQVCVGVL